MEGATLSKPYQASGRLVMRHGCRYYTLAHSCANVSYFRIDLIGSEPCTLRPLSNLGSNLVPKPTPNAMGSKFRTAPTRRRPPPLRLEQEGNTLGKENFLIGSKASPACSVKVHEFKPPSPWLILNKFPTPPSSPAVIPGSRTSTGLSKMLHRGGNTPDVPVSIPGTLKLGHKEYGGMQDENGLPTAPCLSKKKRNASFGSLGKFRTSKQVWLSERVYVS
jgi:hypothetical protein